MTSLQVLCPNGRRQNVKITPNTKLLKVLEDVCQKHKFLPAEEYQLVQGRKTLDLTLSVLYSNLPNNAKLELVKAERSRAESEVIIALQLESGERLQHKFHPGTSLWDILKHWEQQAESEEKYKNKLSHVDVSVVPNVHPVCIYMREEVTGDYALKETPLRTLGLTGGKAVIRLLHRPVEDSVLEEIKTKIDKEKARKARLEGGAKNLPQLSQSSSSTTSTTEEQKSSSAGLSAAAPEEKPVQCSVSVGSQGQSTGQTEIKASDSTTISLNINLNIQSDNKTTSPAQSNKQDESQSGGIRSEVKEDKVEEPAHKMGRMEESCDSGEPMEVEHTVTGDNVMETEETVSSSSEVKPTDNQATGGNTTGGTSVDALRNIPGIEVFTPDDFNDLPPDQQQLARRMAQSFLANMAAQGQIPGQLLQQQQQQQSAGKKKQQRQNAQSQFAEFKFPEETKGKQLYQNEMSTARKEDFQPCDRRAMVFNVEECIRSSSSSDQTEDLPEEFFELTERDIRSLMSERQKRLQDMEDAPLMTSSMRKARLEEEYGRYDRVVIRVQFHDKLVLQGLFRPRETVFAVQKFVKEYLEDKSLPFYLYTAPPKNVLKDKSQTLIEARLVPASLAYFGCEQQKDHYMSEAVMAEMSPKLTADMLVAECLNSDSTETLSSSDQPSYTGKGKKPANFKSSSSSSPSSSTPGATGSRGGSDPSKPVPKWFKVGKK